MPELHTIVCVKVVPKPEEVRVDPETWRLVREGARSEVNPPDMNAMEIALRLKDRHGGRVTILSMGPAFFEPDLRTSLAMGADHICLLSDAAFAGADTLATTYTLAQAARKLERFDLVICGEESSDGATGQVPSGLAEWLDLPQLTLVTEVTLDRDGATVRGRRGIPGGFEILEVPMPAVLSVRTACNEPRFMDYRIKPWSEEPARLTTWTAADMGCEPAFIGQKGSPTIVAGLRQAESRARRRERLEGSPKQAAELLLERLKPYL
ncbi:MAG TPA: electron transfer flavoprotein subunit beta/FixA family protein [Anaerolineales bacterium]|nr:electron transfer flavoprotein subunit beta/FixA family protein [Anaerolineales bacterium]